MCCYGKRKNFKMNNRSFSRKNNVRTYPKTMRRASFQIYGIVTKHQKGSPYPAEYPPVFVMAEFMLFNFFDGSVAVAGRVLYFV
jgi:hypothetical protein